MHLAQILIYIRYVYKDKKKLKLFFKPLETTTPARDVFKFVCDFLEGHGIEWKNLCTVCTDSPCHVGLQIRFLSFNRNCCSKCHWHTLSDSSTGVSCEIPSGLRQIMSLAIQAVNFMKSSALNSRIFSKLCFQWMPKVVH
jgi:hypothetical protein